MKNFLRILGLRLAALASMIVSTATVGMCGEVEPPECLKH